MQSLDTELIRHALQTARSHGFREVEVGVGNDLFTAKLMAGAQPDPTAVSADGAAVEDDKLSTITASAVGYYREGDIPLEVGAEVHKGDQVAVIVALGIANDVESNWEGTVVEVLVEPDQPVEYGQPLAKVKTQ